MRKRKQKCESNEMKKRMKKNEFERKVKRLTLKGNEKR